MNRYTVVGLLALAFFAAQVACGTSEDIFGSLKGIPNPGVTTWKKMDFDAEKDLVQPHILFGDHENFLTEPAYLIVQDQHYLFYEIVRPGPNAGAVQGAVYLAVSDDRFTWQFLDENEPVLTADRAWEDGDVGAPSVLFIDGGFFMWYAGGGGSGVGLAVSENGIDWTKQTDHPVLAPDQKWEGGANGAVGTPCVVRHKGVYKMYYSGGLVDEGPLAGRRGRAIGYAESDDGVRWRKRDGLGSAAANGEVRPVLTASEAWEGWTTDDGGSGWVSGPSVLIEHPDQRDVYRLYYTGNLAGDPLRYDASIGFAGSYDGLDWQKAAASVNPILAEIFPLSLPGITKYLLYGEFAPSVLKKGENYWMIFGQTDPLGEVQGLALAYNDGSP